MSWIEEASEKIRLLDYKNGFVTIEQISSIITESCKDREAKAAKGEELARSVLKDHEEYPDQLSMGDEGKRCECDRCRLSRAVLEGKGLFAAERVIADLERQLALAEAEKEVAESRIELANHEDTATHLKRCDRCYSFQAKIDASRKRLEKMKAQK